MHNEVSLMVTEFISHYQNEKPQFQMADCTFGGGGHSVNLLRQHPSNLKILGCDVDYDIIEHCSYEYSDLIKKRKLALIHSNYVYLPRINVGRAFNRKTTTKKRYDIVLMDLGFSSY